MARTVDMTALNAAPKLDGWYKSKRKSSVFSDLATFRYAGSNGSSYTESPIQYITASVLNSGLITAEQEPSETSLRSPHKFFQ